MYADIEIPEIRRIISSLTPPGDPWKKNEFRASTHPNKQEILIALKGSCRYMMNNSVYTFSPGTVGLISPGSLHAAEYTVYDNDLLHLWVHFTDKSGMYGMVLRVTDKGKYGKIDFKNNPVLFPGSLEQLICRRWKQLEHSGDEKLTDAVMRLPCQLLLNELSLQWQGILAPLKESSLSSFLQSYIRSRSGNGCSIRCLAELTGYSASHISHVFRKETTQSIGAFINLVRTAHVRDALKQGVCQKIIAQELGFSSPRAFWNWMQSIPELKKKNNS